MTPSPSPSSTRGQIILQPAYFSSSAFVHPARADIDSLVRDFARQCPDAPAPFALFSHLWHTHGWTWIHFKVLDARARAAFLDVLTRLFAERIRAAEVLLHRAAALFGLYTLLRTQPSGRAPPLYTAAQVEVASDLYGDILSLPTAFDALHPVRPHVVYVLSSLVDAFHVLPPSELHPRPLPREVVVEDAEETAPGRKKRGRPSRHERVMRTREALAALEVRCGG